MRFYSFDEMLSYHAKQQPNALALCFDKNGENSLSYSLLTDRISNLEKKLRMKKKSCLGVLTDGSPDCVLHIFAAVKAGMQVVLLDENAPETLLKKLIRYTDVDMLWGDEALCQELQGALTAGVSDGGGKILFFTSGTTEQARAVVLTQESLCASAFNGGSMLPLTPKDRLLCILPLCHVFGFVCGLLWGLSCGATVALGRGARHYHEDCDFFRPTAVSVVPMLLSFLLEHHLFNPELSLVLVGAGDCKKELLETVRTLGISVSFGYGLTETSSGVAISRNSDDPFAMEICPDDKITLSDDKEILIESKSCMMQGYYKQPKETADVLKDGILYTGDLGYFDQDGRLHITGRKKEILVLSDGTKIFIPEYESRLAGVLGHTELALTLCDDKLVLVYVGEENPDEIMRRIRPINDEKPRGQQISTVFVTATPLPRTATGKIKRWELLQSIEDK
ncbi:MAG: acyl--CoA ligase [Lachnospiraceae bacterium]|nr:acyl--CoA ligase [Lachnospiraceae bacterium]